MGRITIVTVLSAVLLAGGCATRPDTGTPPARQELAPDAAGMEASAHDRLLFELLVGEFAGSRGAFDQAAEAYSRAIELSGDAAVAERAARVALYAERFGLARTAAERWLALDPVAREAYRIAAVSALREGNPREAAEAFLAFLPEGGAQRDQALDRIGSALAQERDGAAALLVAERIAGRFPDNPHAQLALARVALGTGEAGIALGASRDALALRGQWRAAELLEVESLRRLGREQQALQRLDAMVAASPGDYELRREYARALAAAGRPQQALEQFNALLERQPDDGRILLSGALLALQSGHHDQARQWLKRLLAIGTRTHAANYYLGRLAVDEGDYAEAIRRFRQVGGDYAIDARLGEASAMALSGRLVEARRLLGALRTEEPDAGVRAYATEAELLRRRGRVDEGLAVLDEALEAFPGDTDLLYARAMTRIQADRVEAATRDLEGIIEQEPDNATALNALGYTLADRGEELDRAQTLIERAYRLAPDDPAVIDSMGWVAYRQGRLKEAREYLERAWGFGRDPEIGAHLGEVLWRLGERDRARAIWDEALSVNPDHEVLRETVERLRP
ncbi:tetratricopeptide repeat protein [Arhodomonas sp. SL1]|uniref:tetratricopeptide repeat protein n=1 Tax=Arhodomonas sp. SL1 TaxID=3425691 RepID=UPI003F88097E